MKMTGTLLAFRDDLLSEIWGLAGACAGVIPEFDLLVFGNHEYFRQDEVAVPECIKSVLVFENPELEEQWDLSPHAEIAAAYLRESKSQTVFAVSGETANRVLPILSSILDGSCLIDLKAIERLPSGELCAAKGIWDMNLTARYTFNKNPIFATLQAGDRFAATNTLKPIRHNSEMINIHAYQSYEYKQSDNEGLADAPMLIVAGRGMGSRETFINAQKLAQELKAAFGATRPPVQDAIVPYPLLVGVSGTICAPDKCLILGASGAAAFAAGVEKSNTIIGVNTDPFAEIFSFCDYGLIADCREVTDAMLNYIEGHRNEF